MRQLVCWRSSPSSLVDSCRCSNLPMVKFHEVPQVRSRRRSPDSILPPLLRCLTCVSARLRWLPFRTNQSAEGEST